ncbi:MAG: hypothetical protein Q9228_002604 [Teloschistes exilis]
MLFFHLLLAAGLAKLSLAIYSVKDDYSGENFFNMFNFDTFDDPTHGYVNFVDQATAQSLDLLNVSNGQVTWGVDHGSIASGRGRNSIRLTSKAQYTHGLVVLDLTHMPSSICGTWPAFWMTGPNWPNGGEIDIIEGVNTGNQNQMTMHTSGGCSLAGNNCQGSLGCPIKPTQSNNYGTGMNNAGGGVYAMEWTSSVINIWYFPRDHGLPSDSLGPNPDPSRWGPATASFAGGAGCEIDQHFQNNNIIFDTTFCGDWAGGVWGQDGTCAALAGSCQDYVQNHPEAFADAYWTVNSLKIYEDNGNAPAPAAKVVKLEIPSAVNVVAQESPTPTGSAATPVQPPHETHTHTHGEIFETISPGGTGYVEIEPRHHAASSFPFKEAFITDAKENKTEEVKKARKISALIHLTDIDRKRAEVILMGSKQSSPYDLNDTVLNVQEFGEISAETAVVAQMRVLTGLTHGRASMIAIATRLLGQHNDLEQAITKGKEWFTDESEYSVTRLRVTFGLTTKDARKYLIRPDVRWDFAKAYREVSIDRIMDNAIVDREDACKYVDQHNDNMEQAIQTAQDHLLLQPTWCGINAGTRNQCRHTKSTRCSLQHSYHRRPHTLLAKYGSESKNPDHTTNEGTIEHAQTQGYLQGDPFEERALVLSKKNIDSMAGKITQSNHGTNLRDDFLRHVKATCKIAEGADEPVLLMTYCHGDINDTEIGGLCIGINPGSQNKTDLLSMELLGKSLEKTPNVRVSLCMTSCYSDN